jgi:hypothetical protein
LAAVYNYFRDYDPAVGRYIESDPIGLEGGLNLYLYVENDPVEFWDSTGEQIVIPGTRPRFPGIPGTVEGLSDPAAMGKKRTNQIYNQALGETGLSAAELGRPMGRGREYCVIKCAAVEIVGRGKGKGVTQGSVTCPLYIFGLGLGCDASDAWNAAHDAVNYNVPPGCQKRHCHGIAGACKNWEGGRRGN